MPKAPTTKQTAAKQRNIAPTGSSKHNIESRKRHARRKLPDDVELSSRSPLPPDTNTKGLPTLPMELHLEILSFLPSVPIPRMQSGILPKEYRIKFDIMFALSQTCRVLYHLLKPLLWRTLEACALRNPGHSMNRCQAMAKELVLWLEVVTIRAPALASYVHVFNVALTAFSARNVYKEFTRCLRLLPNLHTLQIVSFPSNHEQDKCLSFLSDAFRGDISLPTIHTLTLPLCLYDKIVALDGPSIVFPNVRHLNLTEMEHGRPVKLRSCTWQEIHSLQLSIFVELYESDILSIVNSFPHLRITPHLCISYRRYPSQSEEEFIKNYTTAARQALQALGRLTRLHTIRLDIKTLVMMHPSRTIEAVADPLVMDTVCDMARKVLLRNLNRVENGDVAEGKVILCVEDELERLIRVTRLVSED